MKLTKLSRLRALAGLLLAVLLALPTTAFA